MPEGTGPGRSRTGCPGPDRHCYVRRPVRRVVVEAAARRAPREHRVGRYARIDRHRPVRVGIPEVILAEGKTVDHLVGIVRSLGAEGVGALVSRPSRLQRKALLDLRSPGVRIRDIAAGRLLRLAGPLGVSLASGTVAVLAAGTSDVPCAEEARALLSELGLSVVHSYDVGVAGLHRLLAALRRLQRSRPEAYLVFAGRAGALPTVVAGLVRAPVIGIPTSVGYGRGGSGEAALNAMLQSCAPIAVVNIDGAVPAALFVAQMFARAPRGPPVQRAPARRRRGASRA